MKIIVLYLFAIAIGDAALLLLTRGGVMPSWWTASDLVISWSLVGGLGGATYCLRGVYLNASVRKQWDEDWKPWYYIRPAVSHISGAASYIFLRAGLLLLEATPGEKTTNLGFLALAFIAGLNVDKFIAKVEDIAQATWGIEKSRAAKEKKNDGT